MTDSFDDILHPPDHNKQPTKSTASVAAAIARLSTLDSMFQRGNYNMTQYALTQDAVNTIELPPYDQFYHEVIRGTDTIADPHNSGYNLLAPSTAASRATIYDRYSGIEKSVETTEEISATRFMTSHQKQLNSALTDKTAHDGV